MKIKRKAKPQVQKYLSSNEHFGIEKYEDSSAIKFYALKYETSIYDFAETLYNDCIKTLNFPTPLICEATFYHSRTMVYRFNIKNCQSLEDILEELCKKIKL